MSNMTPYALMILAAGSLLAADDAKEKGVKEELEKLQGTWEFVSMEVEGVKKPDEEFKKYTVVLKGDQWTVSVADEIAARTTFRLDPTRKPKTIDLTQTLEPNQGRLLRGIYSLEGDKLIMCDRGADKGARPTGFETEPDSGLVLVVLKRVKEGWTRVPRQVLAFYYGWYGNPSVSRRWVHWEKVEETDKRIGSSTHYPTLGPYDSHDPKVIEQHCRWAKDAGLSGFIVSWWAQGDFHDQGLPLLLEAAQRRGLSITAYFETVHSDGAPKPEGALKDVLYLLEHYGKHPAWLKVNGKPVLFVYGRAIGEIKVDGWRQVIAEANQRYPGGAIFIGDQISPTAARVFDGVHTYNPTGGTAGKSVEAIRAWARSTFPKWVETAGDHCIACLTVIPGYDDSKLGRPAPRPITDRHNGQTYRTLWEEAVAADPDWILVTSWNEWHEGSEIEPSVENNEQALRTTAAFASKFRLLEPRRTLNEK